MKDKDARPEQAAELRRKAEEIARENEARSPEIPESLSPGTARQTLHELRVHQIELEMQNEELRRTQLELEAARARYFDLYDLAPVGYVTVGEKGLILEANLTAAVLLGRPRGTLAGQPLHQFIIGAHQDIYYLFRKKLFATGEPQAFELRMLKEDGTAFWVHLEMAAARDGDGAPVCRAVFSDITGTKEAQEALQTAFDDIRTLRGFIPICSSCKKIRDDQGYWSQVEVYVRDHTEAEFTHGICPECMKKLYPGYEEDEGGGESAGRGRAQ